MTRSAAKSSPPTCSFCGKEQSAVQKLIAGPNVSICNECIALCNEILEDEVVEAGLRSPRATLRALEEVVRDLRRLVASQDHVVEEQRAFVKRYTPLFEAYTQLVTEAAEGEVAVPPRERGASEVDYARPVEDPKPQES